MNLSFNFCTIRSEGVTSQARFAPVCALLLSHSRCTVSDIHQQSDRLFLQFGSTQLTCSLAINSNEVTGCNNSLARLASAAMYQNTCGAAATAGGCVETDKDSHSLIPKEPVVPVVEQDYSGFDIVKATQVSPEKTTNKTQSILNYTNL